MTPELLTHAISIRQPWAWLIIHGGKNIENRTWPTKFRGPVFIHASKGMTFQEWLDAYEFVSCFDDRMSDLMPRSDSIHLHRGGIIGSVEIVDCVAEAPWLDNGRDSKPHTMYPEWFAGPWGFVLRNPQPLPFRPCRGSLGFFKPQF